MVPVYDRDFLGKKYLHKGDFIMFRNSIYQVIGDSIFWENEHLYCRNVLEGHVSFIIYDKEVKKLKLTKLLKLLFF